MEALQTSVSLISHEVLRCKISLSRMEIGQLQRLPLEKAHGNSEFHVKFLGGIFQVLYAGE